MRIHKTLEEAKDDMIRVGDIIDYCNRCVETLTKMQKDSFEKVGHGLSDGGLYGFLAYADKQIGIYRSSIPGAIICMINEHLQTEEDKEGAE